MAGDTDCARIVARQLSGYLCGTHSGPLGLSRPGRRLGRLDVGNISTLHRNLELDRASAETELGTTKVDQTEQGRLVEDLREALTSSDVHELVFFGSQAGDHRTGFSDVDAILVISDHVADSPERLRQLRPAVLAAQRAVLSYQPLQHHGFEVATPKLLRQADRAVGLPAATLSNTRSLLGNPVAARLAGAQGGTPELGRTAAHLGRLRTWPAHRWHAYLTLAIFELLPALYLQARGESISKSASFSVARDDFGDAWWPYDVLADVRELWPRVRSRGLEASAMVLRNPWVAAAVWRRIPAAVPNAARSRLTPELLAGLQALIRTMVRRVQ